MTTEQLEREIKEELESIQRKLEELERELEKLNATVSENALSTNNIKSDI